MQEQNSNQSEGKTSLEIMAMAWANSYIQNARESLLDTESFDSTISLHAALQQREHHHIVFIECLKVGTNEISARIEQGCLELDLLTKELAGIKSEINDLQYALAGISESIDFASTKPLNHWMISDIAALDKAKELGLDIPPEWSIADLRYMLDLKIKDNIKGSQFEPRSEVEVNLIKSVLTKHFIDSMTELPSVGEHESAVARIERIARGW